MSFLGSSCMMLSPRKKGFCPTWMFQGGLCTNCTLTGIWSIVQPKGSVTFLLQYSTLQCNLLFSCENHHWLLSQKPITTHQWQQFTDTAIWQLQACCLTLVSLFKVMCSKKGESKERRDTRTVLSHFFSLKILLRLCCYQQYFLHTKLTVFNVYC